ncbi:hypothetical protein DFH09DRAFT_1436718 [Mycena vulgaris]|nr:hypothetical protein DFH09DRAFT_1436718 [Mycena vulgaris]
MAANDFCNGGPEIAHPSFAQDAPALRVRLAEIDEEMAQLQARLVHLAAARKPIVEALKTVFYPVITLPPEITAEIFLHYVDSAHIGGSGATDVPIAPGRTGGCGPLLLASICRTWREIALTLPPIWSSLQLYAEPETISPTESLLPLWLPRAGSHPLEIDIGSPAGTDLLVSLVAPYSPQWQTFACAVYTPITFPSDLIRGRIPLLKRLEVALHANWGDIADNPVTAFADAPQLREVQLIDFALQWISLPWAQLTSLDLLGQTASQCVEILQHTPRLETLFVQFGDTDPAPPALVTLRHLHTLKLGTYQGDITLIDHLTLPALTHLELSSVPLEDVMAHFAPFLVRSTPSLRSVFLDATPSDAVLACLRLVPTVNVVRLTHVGWGRRQYSDLFSQLACEKDLAPDLQSLSLTLWSNVEVPYAALAHMLAARWRRSEQASVRLESFELTIGDNLALDPPVDVAQVEDGVDEMRALLADGLKINIPTLQKTSSTVDVWALCPCCPVETMRG